jgi:S-formylglutathione hydrolase FrmB
MALMQVSFLSLSLGREVHFHAVVPIERFGPDPARAEKPEPFRTLYLLHGYRGTSTDWIHYSRIKELAHKHRIAIIMPSGENHFYLDHVEKHEWHGHFIGRELVDFTRTLFPLSSRREDTWIGGLSMGGYGAIRNGLKYAENFGRIIALSSALITYQIADASPDYRDMVADYAYYRSVFGDLTQLPGSDKDPEALVRQLRSADIDLPDIYMACGTDDFLLDVNRRFHHFLEEERVQHVYIEAEGQHNWDFWNLHIERALDYYCGKPKGGAS